MGSTILFSRSTNRIFAAIMLIVLALPSWASEGLQIRTGSDSAKEKAAKRQLEQLLDKYDLQRWIYTREVLVDEKRWIPSSHPVLTLGPRYLQDDTALLATFLHEQFHWYAEREPERIGSAINAFKQIFPEVPSGRAGARDEESTYLHLIVCDLEYQALVKLLGEEESRQVLHEKKYYTWIYQQVLENPHVRQVNTRFGLVVP